MATEPTPIKQAQHGFEERKLEDSKLEEAILVIERFEAAKKMRRAPVRAASATAAERLEEDRAKLNVAEADEVYAAAVAKIQEEHDPGDRVRVGPYVFEVEEYATMERVESGRGKRVRKFKRVEGDAPSADPLL